MIRVLIMIMVAGFVLSVASLAGAFAIAGPDLLSHGGWTWAGRNWDDDDWDKSPRAFGAETSRTIAWSGADRLDLDLPADVRYIQAAGPATLTITGPKRLVDRVVVRGDSIRFDDGRGWSNRRHGFRKLTIVMRAPNVVAFDVSGINHLAIESYDQDRLQLDVSGSAEVTATGRADTLALDLSGSSDADLGGLKAKGARVDVSGVADVTIAPTEWAELEISGNSDVTLLTNPPRLETDVSGSGRIRHRSDDASSGSPSPTPSPSPSPSPPASAAPKPGVKM